MLLLPGEKLLTVMHNTGAELQHFTTFGSNNCGNLSSL